MFVIICIVLFVLLGSLCYEHANKVEFFKSAGSRDYSCANNVATALDGLVVHIPELKVDTRFVKKDGKLTSYIGIPNIYEQEMKLLIDDQSKAPTLTENPLVFKGYIHMLDPSDGKVMVPNMEYTLEPETKRFSFLGVGFDKFQVKTLPSCFA